MMQIDEANDIVDVTCRINKRGYVQVRKSKYLQLHQHIMGTPPAGMGIDHINGDKLDNRRCNLRFVKHQQNMWNVAARRDGVSKYKGVQPNTGKWKATIRVNGKQFYLGNTHLEKTAAVWYDKAAEMLRADDNLIYNVPGLDRSLISFPRMNEFVTELQKCN